MTRILKSLFALHAILQSPLLKLLLPIIFTCLLLVVFYGLVQVAQLQVLKVINYLFFPLFCYYYIYTVLLNELFLIELETFLTPFSLLKSLYQRSHVLTRQQEKRLTPQLLPRSTLYLLQLFRNTYPLHPFNLRLIECFFHFLDRLELLSDLFLEDDVLGCIKLKVTAVTFEKALVLEDEELGMSDLNGAIHLILFIQELIFMDQESDFQQPQGEFETIYSRDPPLLLAVKQPLSNTPQKNHFRFMIKPPDRYVQLSSQFDSGNMGKATQINELSYRIAPSNDCAGTKYQGVTKSWFYFWARGFPKNSNVRFYISNVNILLAVYNSKDPQSYRPVVRVGEGPWQRLQGKSNLILKDTELQLQIQQVFPDENQKVYIAFSYPWSYQQNLNYLNSLAQIPRDFYFRKEVLINTPEERQVHLITITEGNVQSEPQEICDQFLFKGASRPPKVKKPVVLITSRVHPGETPSSFAMMGILQFLCSNDLRAVLLRKQFNFKIVPMLNPDGVFHGHYRMDIFNQNLNRYYNFNSPQKQPSIYAVKSLVQYYTREGLMAFYFDLHAHGSRKGNFIYGNALDDFVQQVQSQVFCKLIALNCPNFQVQSCNFSKKQMKARDRFEQLTKEGCGRVVINKISNIIHSFTLQCGFISSNSINSVPEINSPDFRINDYSVQTANTQNSSNSIYIGQVPPLFDQNMYKGVGKAMLISILDTFDRNPYNRVYNSNYKSMENLRRLTAFEVFHEADRFRMYQQHTYRKVKNINTLLQNNFLTTFNDKKLLSLKSLPEFKDVQWPSNVQFLSRYNKRKIIRFQPQFNTPFATLELTSNPDSPKSERIKETESQQLSSVKESQQKQKFMKDQKSVRDMSQKKEQRKRKPTSIFQLRLGNNSSAGINISSIPSYLMNPGIKTFKKQLKKEISSTIKTQLKKEMEQIKVQIKGAIRQQIQRQIKQAAPPQILKTADKFSEITVRNKRASFTSRNLENNQQIMVTTMGVKREFNRNLPSMKTINKPKSNAVQSFQEHYFYDQKLVKPRSKIKNNQIRLPELAQKATLGKMMVEMEGNSSDLNEMMKNTLRWEAMKMKELVKKYAKKN